MKTIVLAKCPSYGFLYEELIFVTAFQAVSEGNVGKQRWFIGVNVVELKRSDTGSQCLKI